jgi:hypothetical protein
VVLLDLCRANDYLEDRGVPFVDELSEGIDDIPPAPDKSTLRWRGTSSAPPTVPYR